MSPIRTWSLLLMALVLAAAFLPPVSAANKTNATPPGWVGEFDEWAGQKDMSAYSVTVQPATIRKMDAETARIYPGVVVIDPSMTFPLVESIVYTNASPVTTVDLQYLNTREKTDSTISLRPAPENGNHTVVTTSPAPVAIATPIYPGRGDSVSDLYGRHPTIKGNTAIMDYIGKCGIGGWYEKKLNAEFISVHIPPGNSCGKQLVFLNRKGGGRDDPTKIAAVWILDASETWSDTMDPVYPSLLDYRTREFFAGIRLDPVFVVPCAVIAFGLLAILCRMIRRKG